MIFFSARSRTAMDAVKYLDDPLRFRPVEMLYSKDGRTRIPQLAIEPKFETTSKKRGGRSDKGVRGKMQN